MKRDIIQSLINWKNDENRRPLLLRGARQTGKTYIIKYFGEREFQDIVTLNFERNPEYKEVFVSYNPQEVVERISLFVGKQIKAGRTLLFFDEIQESPKAIMSLRYFYEEMPKLHVVGAGSLLEFALNSENCRVPIGRIQYMYLKPMSFGEFLDAMNEGMLRKHVSDIKNLESIPKGLHDKLNELLRKYFLIGGMPAVMKDYIENKDILRCQRIQQNLIQTFIDDFSKYARASKHKYLEKVFYSVPAQVGNKYKYSNVDSSVKSRDLKEAVELLENAGIVTRVKCTSGSALPLEAEAKTDFYKLLFIDIGLLHAICGIYLETVMQNDFTAIFSGKVTEQFAGQQLICLTPYEIKPNLYYWVREARGSKAEIDFLISKGTEIIPIEVKSGQKGTLKSLLSFIEKYHPKKALKISQAPYSISNPIVNLPLYSIEVLNSAAAESTN